MKTINRRSFLSTTAKVSGAAFVLSQLPSDLFAAATAGNMPLGFQTWTVRDKLSKDFAGTLKMVADMGYQLMEMCSPKGYEQIGFGPLAKMKTSDIRKAITDAGLSCPSCHFGFAEFNDENLDNRIEFAKELGLHK